MTHSNTSSLRWSEVLHESLKRVMANGVSQNEEISAREHTGGKESVLLPSEERIEKAQMLKKRVKLFSKMLTPT